MAANINIDGTREIVIYHMKCMRNHAVEAGGNVVDGCGQFTTDDQSSSCAVCGCHRNFHMRAKMEKLVIETHASSVPEARKVDQEETIQGEAKMDNNAKRMRAKISPGKRERLKQFADRIGWKLKNEDEEEIMQFCSELGITKPILKNWINNNRKRMMHERSMANQSPEEIVLQNQY